MSLVEKALKKLQDSGVRPVQREQSVALGSIVQSHSPLDPVAHPSRRSDKFVRIDRQALRTAGLMPPEQAERQLMGEYRQIKRPLLAAAFGKGRVPVPNGRAIMLASSLPGEGKTYTSINLALSMVLEKDITVVLADADLAKPHISHIFGVEGEPGLIEALQDHQIDIESLVIPTDVPGLSVLPAGRKVDTATELLASARMEQLVAHLANADPTRIILFDSPPLLLTSESRVLSHVVGQVALVVCANSTPRAAVTEALQFIGERDGLSLILNQSQTTTTASYYGYGEYGSAPLGGDGERRSGT